MSKKVTLPVAAELIRETRIRAGISQAELASRLEIAPSAVSDWEAGRKDPSVSALWRVVAACGLELRLNAVLPSEQDKIQSETDFTELATGNAWIQSEQAREIAQRCGVRKARAF